MCVCVARFTMMLSRSRFNPARCRGTDTTARIILASASPRRRELLALLLGGSDCFESVTSSFEETLPKASYTPTAYTVATALGKARDVASKTSSIGGDMCPRLVIGCDTVVELDGTILEKPRDDDHAMEMLRSLRGKTHHVHTGVALIFSREGGDGDGDTDDTKTFSCTTSVRFSDEDNLDDDALAMYVASGDPKDKAGAYGIQTAAGAFVEGIEGCYYNVMGLPLNRLAVEMSTI